MLACWLGCACDLSGLVLVDLLDRLCQLANLLVAKLGRAWSRRANTNRSLHPRRRPPQQQTSDAALLLPPPFHHLFACRNYPVDPVVAAFLLLVLEG